MGVPTLGCECHVCRSTDPRDNRTRPSVLLSRAGRNVVIDTTPDFRFQALRVGLQRLDAVVFTHAHADHILGFDDIRPFNMRQKSEVPVYGSVGTLSTLRRTCGCAGVSLWARRILDRLQQPAGFLEGVATWPR